MHATRTDTITALGKQLVQQGYMLATAESCTGGLIGAACTDVPGSSAWFCGGVIAYANEVKTAVLQVPAATLLAHGAVSEATVRAMVLGACALTGAQVGIAVSGIAGPDGGSAEKPVGTVWFGFAVRGVVTAQRMLLEGDRQHVRNAAVDHALATLAHLTRP